MWQHHYQAPPRYAGPLVKANNEVVMKGWALIGHYIDKSRREVDSVTGSGLV